MSRNYLGHFPSPNINQRIKIYAILVSLLFIIAVYQYAHPTNPSGFLFGRLADLTYNSPTGDITTRYHSFPAIGSFFGILSQILNVQLFHLIQYPFIIIFSIISLPLITRTISDGKSSILISSSLILFIFIKNSAFSEYVFGMTIYLIFLYCLIKYMFNSDRRWAYISIVYSLIILLIGIRFAQWGTGFLIVVCLLLLLTRQKKGIPIKTPIILATFLLVLFLFYNPKLYEQLIFRLIELESLFSSAETVDSFEYSYSSQSPPALRILNILWFFLATVPVLIGFLLATRKYGLYLSNRNKREIVFIAILLGATSDVIIRLIIGRGLSLRTVALLSPIVAGFYVYNYVGRDAFYTFGTAFLIISALSTGFVFIHDGDRPAVHPDSTSSTIEFIHQYDDQMAVTTDHHTRGELRLAIAELGENPRNLDGDGSFEKIVPMLFEFETPPDDVPSLLIYNEMSKNHPPHSGDNWQRYKPLNQAPDFKNDHTKLNNVFSNGDITIIYNKQ